MPNISVLMPCYNMAAHLEETLGSIASQTLTDFEVVAVDDGSSDQTPEILGCWAEKDPRFRVLLLEHAGIIPALNAGLAVCRSDLVARMDADDRMHPARLEKQVGFMQAHPETDLVSSLVAGFPAGEHREGLSLYIEWLNSLPDHDSICREMFVESPLCHPSVTFRKSAVLALGGYQEKGWPEDYDLWLRGCLAGWRFAKIPEVLLEWREHPHRLTRTDSRYSLENFIRAKAHYLAVGPLADRDTVIIWGAGMHGRRLSKHLLRAGVPLEYFVDIDPKKIGRTRRGLPIISPEELERVWSQASRPVLLSAVGARGARDLIRQRLSALGLMEAQDWWAAA
ncbi:MAG: glycosyltransferase [Anaerolineales bacterium]|nr:glycosyltransferase [Anaerolineales bacterium]